MCEFNWTWQGGRLVRDTEQQWIGGKLVSVAIPKESKSIAEAYHAIPKNDDIREACHSVLRPYKLEYDNFIGAK